MISITDKILSSPLGVEVLPEKQSQEGIPSDKERLLKALKDNNSKLLGDILELNGQERELLQQKKFTLVKRLTDMDALQGKRQQFIRFFLATTTIEELSPLINASIYSPLLFVLVGGAACNELICKGWFAELLLNLNCSVLAGLVDCLIKPPLDVYRNSEATLRVLNALFSWGNGASDEEKRLINSKYLRIFMRAFEFHNQQGHPHSIKSLLSSVYPQILSKSEFAVSEAEQDLLKEAQRLLTEKIPSWPKTSPEKNKRDADISHTKLRFLVNPIRRKTRFCSLGDGFKLK